MVHKISKPDYYTVLKLRRSSVSRFLSETGVRTTKALNTLLEALKGQYTITDLFINEATEHVALAEAANAADVKYVQEKLFKGLEVPEEVKAAPEKKKPAPKRKAPRKKKAPAKKVDEN